MAKSKFDITSVEVQIIIELAGKGLQLYEIWEYFGISKSTWYAKVAEYEENHKNDDDFIGILDAIKQSKAHRGERAAGKLWQYIESGGKLGLTALMFYLKTQHRWRENPKEEKEEEEHHQPQQLDYSLQNTSPTEAARIYQKIMEAK